MSETSAPKATNTKPTPKGEPAPAVPPPAAVPALPSSLLDHPAYREANTRLARVKAEADRLEAAIWDVQKRRDAVANNRDARAQAILDGREPESVDAIEKQHRELVRQHRDTLAAVELAKREVNAARQQARAALIKPFLPHQREIVRRVAFGVIEVARQWQTMQDFHDAVDAADLGGGEMAEPLARVSPWGRLDDPTSTLNVMLGDLIDRGYLDTAADADKLAGTLPQVAGRPAVQAPPRPPRKANEKELAGMRRMGVAIPRG